MFLCAGVSCVLTECCCVQECPVSLQNVSLCRSVLCPYRLLFSVLQGSLRKQNKGPSGRDFPRPVVAPTLVSVDRRLYLSTDCTSLQTVPLYRLYLSADCTSLQTVPLCRLYLSADCTSLQTVPLCRLYLSADCLTAD